jgi:hypothetical protein
MRFRPKIPFGNMDLTFALYTVAVATFALLT